MVTPDKAVPSDRASDAAVACSSGDSGGLGAGPFGGLGTSKRRALRPRAGFVGVDGTFGTSRIDCS